MIKEAIVKIVSKQDLTYDEAYAVMNEIMSGETTPTQNAAFLAALSTKSAKAETTDEIVGCAAAMRDQIGKEAEGFLYIVSSLGVTGTRSEIKTDLASIVKVVRENTAVPSAIGFGISTPEQAAKMAGIADGAIVGSAIIKLLEQYGKDAPEHIGAYVKSMKDAVREYTI
mgnify:CR=1 FL=1